MKLKNRTIFFVSILVVALALTASRPLQETAGDWLGALITYFATLTGFAAFVTFVVNIAKRFGWVSDGNAGMVAKYLNLAGLVVVGVLQVIFPQAISSIDIILGLLAQLGGVLLPILALVFSWPVANSFSGFTHDNVRGVKLIGYSNSK